MTRSVAKQLTLAAMILAILVVLAEDASAQRRYGKAPPRYVPTAAERGEQPRTASARATKAQFENDSPQVELPGAAYEADALPAGNYSQGQSLSQGQGFTEIESVVSPALDDAVDSVLQPDFEGSYPEPVPFTGNMDDGYLLDYDEQYADEPAPMYSTGTWFRRGSWYTRMDVVALTPHQPRTGALPRFDRSGTPIPQAGLQVVTQDTATASQYLATSLVSHYFAPGAKLTFGRFLGRDAAGRDHQFDMTFTGLFEWESSRSLESAGTPGTPGFLNGVMMNINDPIVSPFFSADQQEFTYGADFDSYEWNYYIRTRPGATCWRCSPMENGCDMVSEVDW